MIRQFRSVLPWPTMMTFDIHRHTPYHHGDIMAVWLGVCRRSFGGVSNQIAASATRVQHVHVLKVKMYLYKFHVHRTNVYVR